MKDLLFEAIKINKLEVKNRIYLPAMHLSMANDYDVTDRLIDFYVERARGGAGMIVIGYATVNALAGGMPNLIGAHEDDFIPGLSKLASAIKAEGAACALQINHAGANAVSLFINSQPVAPSDFPGIAKEAPRPLTLEEIAQTIEDFGDAALRVKQAGFDAVEVLAAGGYLISQFLSTVSNKRTDDYGGSFENRMRFGLDVMKNIRAKVGDDFPVVARISGNEFMPGGLGRKELQTWAKHLEQEGRVDAINVNVGWHQAKVPQITSAVPRGLYAYLSKGIKANVSIPVVASHRINDPKVAREALNNNLCDLTAVGRGLIADPYWPEKAKTGRENEIVHCIACAQGCFDSLFRLTHVECMCNPKAGHEKDRKIVKTEDPKKVMIIGGGPAGMSAALSAKEKGHHVTLYEESLFLGGQLHLAGAPPGREEFVELANDLAKQLSVYDISVVLNTKVNEAVLEKEKPDAVILATGAIPSTPPVKGIEGKNVVQAWDVLLDKVNTGKKVVVLGGGAVGVETALFLAEKGTLSGDELKFLLVNKAEKPEDLYELATKGTKEVILVEMIGKVGKDIGRTSRWGMMQDLERYGVEVLVNTRAVEITEEGVRVECDGKETFIDADSVVLAAGALPNNELQEILDNKGIPYQVTGDAATIGTAFDAVHDGFLKGVSV